MAGIGKVLLGLGLIVSLLTWFLTAVVFFSDGRAGLAVILILIPPSELILPWVASTTLGLMSLGGFLAFILGAGLASLDD